MVTSSSSAPLTDALRAWLGSWCGQLDRWGRRVCVQHEFCPGHHGSALWQLVHSDSDSVCVCTSFRSAQLSPERIAAADKFQVVTWNTFLVQLSFFFFQPHFDSFYGEAVRMYGVIVTRPRQHILLYQLNRLHWLDDQPGRHYASAVCCLCVYTMIQQWAQMCLTINGSRSQSHLADYNARFF